MRRLILTCLGVALVLAGCGQDTQINPEGDALVETEPDREDLGKNVRAIAGGAIHAVWYAITLGYDERQSEWYRRHRPLAYREHQAHMRARNYEGGRRVQSPGMGCNFSYTPNLSGISIPGISGK
jgi:hypothetical protein